MRILGIVLLILGALALGYQGFTYVPHEPIAQVGSEQVWTERRRTIWVPPLVGGIALASGIIVLIITKPDTTE